MGLSSLDTVNKALESPSEALAIQVSRQRHHTGPTRGRFRRENVGSGMRDMPMPAVRFPTSRGRQECKVSSGSEPPRRPAPRDVSIQTKAPECDEDRRIFRQWVSGRGRLSREKIEPSSCAKPLRTPARHGPTIRYCWCLPNWAAILSIVKLEQLSIAYFSSLESTIFL
jgi:hypothetical protein